MSTENKNGPSMASRSELPCSDITTLNANGFTTKEILKIQKRARYVARKRGYPQHADDFAQQVFVYFAEKPDRGATIDQLFIDYIRSDLGRPGKYGYHARGLAARRTFSLDEKVGTDEGETLYHDIIGNADRDSQDDGGTCYFGFLFSGKEWFLYERYFVDQATEKTIGAELGVAECRVCQMLGSMKKRIKNYVLCSDGYDRFIRGNEMKPLLVDWIRI